MAKLAVGTLTPINLKMGTVSALSAYFGTTLVWSAGNVIVASANKASATINGTFTAATGGVGTIAASGNRATAAINGVVTNVATFAKYRTFNGVTDQITWTIGNLANQPANPQTLVVVTRLRDTTGGGELLYTPGYDPIDWYLNDFSGNTGGPVISFADALDWSEGPTWTTNTWSMWVFRTFVGTIAKWSVSTYNGTSWPTPTHTNAVVAGLGDAIYSVRNWPASGIFTMGTNAPFDGDIVMMARFSSALSDAQVNAMIGGVATIQATPTITNLWMLGQATVTDLVGTTVPTVSGTTLSTGDSPFPTTPPDPNVTGTIAVSAKQATAVINGTAVTNATGTIAVSSKLATATISGTFTGTGPPSGTINASSKLATATINATYTAPSAGFAKYRTFNGTTNKIDWTIGNLATANSCPQTFVFVVRLLSAAADGEILIAPSYDPVDVFFNKASGNGGDRISLNDGFSTIEGQTMTVANGWCLYAIRSLTGSIAQMSQSIYSGTAWPTPTHAAALSVVGPTTLTQRPYPSSGSMGMGYNDPLNFDCVCMARFSTALTDAQINNMVNGVAAIQATPGITNLWMLGQTTPADLVGTTVPTLTGTTLSSGDSPFPA